MVSQEMLEANVTNLKSYCGQDYPGAYGVERLHELATDVSDWGSLRIRSMSNACRVIVRIVGAVDSRALLTWILRMYTWLQGPQVIILRLFIIFLFFCLSLQIVMKSQGWK